MSSGAFRKKKTSFAQVSNVALRDENLSLKAKGLLALIESYLSLDNFTLYKQFLINKSKDGETAFRSAWKELKDRGYLIQYKLKDEETKQFYYEYEVCDNPQNSSKLPHVENPPVANNHVTPCVEKPQVEIPLVVNPQDSLSTTQENHTGFIHLYNNNIHNNTLYINNIRTNILTNIEYNTAFINSLDKELVDNIVDIIVDILVNDYQIIKINNTDIQGWCVKSMMWKVNMYHIEYTVNAIKNYPDKIYNMRNFVLSVLYNSVLTLDAYYQNLVHT